MNSSSLSYQDVLQLVELISGSSAFSELRIRSGDVEIDLRRSGAPSPPSGPVAVPAPVAIANAPTPAEPKRAPAPVAIDAPASKPKRPDGVQVAKAPMVGTIYHAPEPGAAPFVIVGTKVAVGDQLGIIEVMKLLNPIRAEAAGIVSEILVGDGQVVEYGQELFVITPG